MEVKDTRTLGNILRRRRKSLGLTQLDAAGLCGVGERFLSELERGKETASLGMTLKVIKRLGLKVVLEGQPSITEETDEHH